MTIRKVNLAEMFGRFQDQWSPKVNTRNVRNERTVPELDRL